MELGVYTFADLPHDVPATGEAHAERMQQLMLEIETADRTGLDVFAVGEHHRPDFIVSAPAVVLGAAAARTERIRLSSAVTVLSSDDPVRVYQDFATIDLISGGRAEIMAGRGSFTESFPLFGYNLADYDALFAEKLEMLLTIIRSGERVTWPGTRHTQRLDDAGIYPRPLQHPLPLWLAIGGTPQSAVRAGTLGLPLALAIIGGEPARFAPFVELYRESARRAGHDPATLGVGINAHGYIAPDERQARDELWPTYQAMMNRIARERGFTPVTRDEYERMCGPDGHLLVGTPEQVADKLVRQHEHFRNTRYLIQFNLGSIGHEGLLRSIELFGTEVAPRVRDALASRSTTPTTEQE